MKIIITGLVVSLLSVSGARSEPTTAHDNLYGYRLSNFGQDQFSAYTGMNSTESSSTNAFGGSVGLQYSAFNSNILRCNKPKEKPSDGFIGWELIGRGEFLEGMGLSNISGAIAGTSCFSANSFFRAEVGNVWDSSNQNNESNADIGLARSTIHGPYAQLSFWHRQELFEWDINVLGGHFQDGSVPEDTVLLTAGASADLPGGVRVKLRAGTTEAETSGRAELLSFGITYNVFGSAYLRGSIERQWWDQQPNRVYTELGLFIGW